MPNIPEYNPAFVIVLYFSRIAHSVPLLSLKSEGYASMPAKANTGLPKTNAIIAQMIHIALYLNFTDFVLSFSIQIVFERKANLDW